MKKKLLITGAVGFLGGSFYDFISSKKSFDIFGVDIKNKPSDNKCFDCDLCDQEQIKNVLLDINPDYIFHFAGARPQKRDVFLESNFLTTKSLFEAILKIENYIPRVIIPGSAAEYGVVNQSERGIDEQVKPCPTSGYGFIKSMETELSLFYGRQGIDVVVGRIFNVIGKGVPADLCVGGFCEQIVSIEKNNSKNEIDTFNLDSIRDFLDVDDVCSALLAIAENGESGEIYNICSGSGLLIRDVLARLVKFSISKDICINEKTDRYRSVVNSVGSNVKLQKLTGWKPAVSIETSLKNTLEYYRSG